MTTSAISPAEPAPRAAVEAAAGAEHGTRAKHGRGVHALTAAMVAAAVAGCALVWGRHGTLSTYHISWWLLIVLFCAGEASMVRLQFRRGGFSFTMSEVPLVVALFFATPAELMVMVIVGGALAMVHHRVALIKGVFNTANLTIGGALTVVVVRAFVHAPLAVGPRTWVVVGVATSATAVVGALLVWAVISLSEDSVDMRRLAFGLVTQVVSFACNACVGLAVATVISYRPAAAWLLAIPAGTVFVAYRAYVREREKHEILEFLYESNRLLTGTPDLEQAIVALLDNAREMFHTETAEAVICPPDDSPLLRICVDGSPKPRVMEQVVDEATLSMWERIAVSPGPVVVGRAARGRKHVDIPADDAAYLATQRLHNAMLAPLRGETRAIGMLMVGDQLGEGTFFDKQDVRLFEALSSHVSVALENGRLEQSLSQLRELEQKLTQLAFHDPLTGLANRSLFAEHVADALAVAKAEDRVCAVLFIDLDDFKTVNDTLGHETGDQLLAAVAERITSCLRPTDRPARLGGDEFAVVIEDALTSHAAERIAARITDALRLPIRVGGCDLYTRASIGIATSQEVHSADELLRNADLAMYMAKGDGKGRYRWFRAAMRAEVVQRHQLKSDLERANERGEFQVYYQPIVDLRTGRPVSAEALVRWAHPERGLIFPASFIPAAERSGIINEIGRFVLQDACVQVAEWQRICAPSDRLFAVAVNLSPAQFAQPDLVSQVEEAVDAAGIDPASLVLEITEGLMLQGSERVLRTLDRLSGFGVRLAMDDFGTGYASLSSLRELPMDMIKIAKTFTDDISGNEEKSPFVRAMIELGEALGLVTLAEGIETAQQARELERLGCQLGQGYHFARPVSASGIELLLRRHADQHSQLAKVIAFPA